MIDKIRAYIAHEFADLPQTPKVQELQEELISNLAEKYDEQLQQGKNEAAAYNAVISSVGDLTELVESVRPQPLQQLTPEERKRRALLISTAVALYILSPIIFLLFESLNFEMAGIMMMFIVIALATAMLIYNYMTRPIPYVKQEETLVEDFKAWSGKSNSQQAAFRSFRGAFWTLVVAVYLMISFLFGIWMFSWIIFIIAAAVENIVKGVIQIKEGH